MGDYDAASFLSYTDSDSSLSSDFTDSVVAFGAEAVARGRVLAVPLQLPVAPIPSGLPWLARAPLPAIGVPLPCSNVRLQSAAGLPLRTFSLDGGQRRINYVDTADLAFARSVPPPSQLPLLLIHDFPAGPHVYARLLISLAARGLRAICPTLRGYGPGDGQLVIREPSETLLAMDSSTAPARPFHSIRDQASDFAALLSLLGLSRVVVVGQNWSTIVASHFTLLYPQLVSGLVLLSVPYQPPATVYIPASLLAARADPQLGFKVYFSSDRAVDEMNAYPDFMLRSFLRGGGQAEADTVARLSSVDIRDKEQTMNMLRSGIVPSPLFSLSDEAFLVAWLASIGGTKGPLAWWRAEPTTIREFAGVATEIASPVLFVAGSWQRFARESNRVEMRRLCGDLVEKTLEGIGVCPALETPDVVAANIVEWMSMKGLQ